jgi:hypothetical protein
MPTKRTKTRSARARAEGKSPSTQAGEFVRAEIEDIRAGKHGARSARQVIAIGLSKARRAGVALPPPKKGSVSKETRRKAIRDSAKARRRGKQPVSRKRSRATTEALKREGKAAASSEALSRQARGAAGRRTGAQRSAMAKKAARNRAQRIRTRRNY